MMIDGKRKEEKGQGALTLWSNKPAREGYEGWEKEAYPIGNGDCGAKVFGGIGRERVQFNEKSLWSGTVLGVGENTNGNGKGDYGVSLRKIQTLLLVGEEEAAQGAMELLQGDEIGLGAYQNFGELFIEFPDIRESNVEEYKRSLDLREGIARVSFQEKNKWHKREMLASFPNQVIGMRFQGKGINCKVEIHSAQDESTLKHKHVDQEKPEINSDEKEGNPEKIQEEKKAISYQEHQLTILGKVNGNTATELLYGAAFHIKTDGEIEATIKGVRIKEASIIEGYLSCKTNYGRVYPEYRRAVNLEEECVRIVSCGAELGYESVRKQHLKDYQELFGRVSLSLGRCPAEEPLEKHGKIPLEERLKSHEEALLTEILEYFSTEDLLKEYQRKNGDSPYSGYLEGLLYQYGRYLLISASRENGLPANLQGVWNASNEPPWQSDYHLNINLQMNYWPALVSNLPETLLPLMDYVKESLVIPGRKTAYHYAGIGSGDTTEPTGWMAHTQNNIFGHTGPGSNWRWGWDPGAGAFILQNLYEYFRFTRDIERLRDEIYPMMEEAARMWSQLLIWDEKQERLVASPCYSPEHGPVSSGATFDQQMVWQLYHDTLEGVRYLRGESCPKEECVSKRGSSLKEESLLREKNSLKKEGDLKEDCSSKEESKGIELDEKLLLKIEKQMEQLKPYHIGEWGQIKEWFWEDEWEERGYNTHGVVPDHRHISHLMGLYPGFDPCFLQEDYKKAATISLLDRGESNHDVATGWSKAHKMAIWARLGEGEKAYNYVKKTLKESIMPNLWSLHPPFQIDGNYGYTAGINEMLLQSQGEAIHLLPALPKSWEKEGYFKGLVARGNIQVDCSWKDGQVTEFALIAKKDTVGKVCYNRKVKKVELTKDTKFLLKDGCFSITPLLIPRNS